MNENAEEIELGPFDLRTKAIGAHHAVKKVEEADLEQVHQQLGAEARQAFMDHFGEEPDEVNGHVVRSGDVKLLYIAPSYGSDFSHHACWTVIGTCPHCGEETTSSYCWNVAAIGAELEHFRPDFAHQCPPRLTWRQRLLSWLTKVLAEKPRGEA